MSAIDFFAKTVAKYHKAKPGFTRRLIRAAYGGQALFLKYRPNPAFLPSQRFLARVSMKYTLLPMKKPERSALVNLFTPCEILHAMDLYPQCAEGYSSYLTGGRCEAPFLDGAEAAGVPETYCSYHKALIGAVECGVLAKPRFTVTTSVACDANTGTFRRIAAHFGIPEFYIDVPFERSEEAVGYVAGQLRQMVTFVEDAAGEKMDAEKFRRAVRNANESAKYQRLFLERLGRVSYPNTVTLEMFRVFATNILMGSDDARDFYKMQYADIVAHGRAPGGETRVLWSHVLPYYAPPLKELFDRAPGVRLVAGDLNAVPLMELDEERPFESMAERLIANYFNGKTERKVERFLEMAERLNADGAVVFCHWGCKQSNGSAYQLKDALMGAGVPALVLDGDGCDRRNCNEGQVETRLAAFLEMIGNAKEER